MPLVSMRQLLDHAAEHGYGLPAFNVNRPMFNSFKSLVTHAVFGVGLFIAATVTASLVDACG